MSKNYITLRSGLRVLSLIKYLKKNVYQFIYNYKKMKLIFSDKLLIQ